MELLTQPEGQDLTCESQPTPDDHHQATAPPTAKSPPGTLDSSRSVSGSTPAGKTSARSTTPQPSPTGTVPATAAGLTPMRRGRVHALDDLPRNRQTEAERWTRAQAEMTERGRIVEDMRNGRFRAPTAKKNVAGGDALRDSGIPVWGGPPMSTAHSRPATDPFEYARVQVARIQAASAAAKTAANSARTLSGPKPLTFAPPLSAAARGKQRAATGRQSPPPTAGPSARMTGVVSARSARSEPWRPLTQYLPHQLDDESSGDERNFPRLERRPDTGPRAYPEPASRVRARRESMSRPLSPLARKSDEAEARRDAQDLEIMNEEAARRIQEQLWAEEREYNRSHRSQSVPDPDVTMEDDVFGEDGEEEEVLAPDSDSGGEGAGGYDSFDDVSDMESPDGDDDHPALLNIEPAVGDDRAKAAARASIFADTKARIRWSPITCEPIAGMTQAKLVAGIDPTQLQQHSLAANRLDDVYIGFVHAIGGTKSVDIDRVTLVTALDTMIGLTCRAGTKVLFSAARQDPNGPRLRPGTVLIDTPDDELGTLWQQSAHWAQAGVRFTVQKYHQEHSAFMVTLEGTRRNRQSVAHGVRAAARKLPQLKAVFRQYNTLHPGKGRAARDNLIRSVTARPLALTSRRALGFGTIQYNIYAKLHERDQDTLPSLNSDDDERTGYPPLTAEMHWSIRDAFQHITIVDGRLGDATPIAEPWDCAFCFAESHPVGKCELKDIEGWFKTYDEFLAANAPASQNSRAPIKKDRKGKAKAPAPHANQSGGGHRGPQQMRGNQTNASQPHAGPSRRGGGV